MTYRILLLTLAVALLAGAAPAIASTIVYQCGPGVCAVDPDAGGAPRTLAADGTVAGLTRDGATASWVDASGTLVQGPAAGGAPHPVYAGTVGNQPSMAPDGSQYLWWQIGPGVFGGLSDVYIYRYVVGQAESVGVSHCVQCTTSHGWSGANTPIAAFPGSDRAASDICRIEAGPGSSCVQRLASDARGGLGFPAGSPDGSTVAAALAPGTETGIRGAITLYSAATGAPTAGVTAGPADTSPTWSPDGRQLAFDRGGDQIVVHDLTTGAERVVATGGHTPFWGGAPTPPAVSLTAAQSRRISSWKTLKGKVAGATAVEVSLSRRSGKRCVAYTGKAFRTVSCAKVPRVRATVSGSTWTVKVKGLKRGRYTIRVRALDAGGKAVKSASRTVSLR